MRRINTSNKATNLFGAGKHGWKNGVPGTSDRPTNGQAEWFNAVQEELANLIEAAGIVLDDEDNTQLQAAVEQLSLSPLANSALVGQGDALIAVKQVFTSAVARTLHAKMAERITPADAGAVGDGVTNDSAKFGILEAAITGRVIDLCGLTYLVTTEPVGNTYVNGYFKLDAAVRPALSPYRPRGPAFKPFGGQLRALRAALENPLEQQTTIVFVGDSITWGATLPENAVSTPRARVPADPRDDYTAPSWVNEFKRYIGREYFPGAAGSLSNWSEAVSGQTTVTFERTVDLYPGLVPFTTTLVGASVTVTDVFTNPAGPQLGARYVTTDQNNAGTSYSSLTFNFTGSSFTLYYASVAASVPMDYQLFVDGVSIGVFSTLNGTQNRLTRTHNFGYVRNKTVEIRSKRVAGTGPQTLQLEAIRIPKRCTLVNQGIIGSTALSYKDAMFGAYGPSIMTADVNYAFVQLGTNDRVTGFTDYNQPNGINNFERNLRDLLALISPQAQVVLMNSLPATNESPATYTFGMRDVKMVVHRVGAALSHDVIDNYAIFDRASHAQVMVDGLHPGNLGHQMIFSNLVGAFEAA